MFKFAIALLAVIRVQANAQDYPILFTKQINNVDNICLLSSNGEIEKITDHARKDSSPMLSPDGKQIVFTSERVGWWKIWLLDLEHKKFRQLTNAGSAEYAPCWSPTGDEIAFVSSRDGNAEIYLMAKDGSNLRNLTRNSVNDNTPFWAKDNKIYYASEINGVFQIVRIDPDGSNREILLKGAGNKYMPQLSPNGETILYYSAHGGNSDIYTMQLNGTGRQRLTTDPLLDIRPRWSPDGQQIVFERGDKQRNQHIFIMNQDGSNQKQLTFSHYNYAPSFVANCSFLCPETKLKGSQ